MVVKRASVNFLADDSQEKAIRNLASQIFELCDLMPLVGGKLSCSVLKNGNDHVLRIRVQIKPV